MVMCPLASTTILPNTTISLTESGSVSRAVSVGLLLRTTILCDTFSLSFFSFLGPVSNVYIEAARSTFNGDHGFLFFIPYLSRNNVIPLNLSLNMCADTQFLSASDIT